MGCGYLLNDIVPEPFTLDLPDAMTIQFCVELCRGQLKPVAAVKVQELLSDLSISKIIAHICPFMYQQAGLCMCIDELRDNIAMVPTNWCNLKCGANQRQMCGGGTQYFSLFNVGKFISKLMITK